MTEMTMTKVAMTEVAMTKDFKVRETIYSKLL